MKIKKIIGIIKNHKSFLIISHINPDGDSLGSQLAMARILKQLGKKVYMLSDDRPPSIYAFLPDIKKIKTNIKSFKGRFEVAFILDCAKMTRIGKVRTLINKEIKISIDHHPEEAQDLDVHFKNTAGAATAELLYDLFKRMKVKIDKKVAMLLYIGIATDTGFFKYANTTPKAHEIASDLIKLGAKPTHLVSQLYGSESIKRLKLLGLSLKTLKLYKNGKIASMKVTKKMYRETDTGQQDTENFIDFPRSMRGTSVALFFREQGNGVKVSFRAKGDFDVNKIAKFFGGGGHLRASGCTLTGNINNVERSVIGKVKEAIK